MGLSARTRHASEFSLTVTTAASHKSPAQLPVVVYPGSYRRAEPAGVRDLPVRLHQERGPFLRTRQALRERPPVPEEELPEGCGAQIAPELRQTLHPDADV